MAILTTKNDKTKTGWNSSIPNPFSLNEPTEVEQVSTTSETEQTPVKYVTGTKTKTGGYKPLNASTLSSFDQSRIDFNELKDLDAEERKRRIVETYGGYYNGNMPENDQYYSDFFDRVQKQYPDEWKAAQDSVKETKVETKPTETTVPETNKADIVNTIVQNRDVNLYNKSDVSFDDLLNYFSQDTNGAESAREFLNEFFKGNLSKKFRDGSTMEDHYNKYFSGVDVWNKKAEEEKKQAELNNKQKETLNSVKESFKTTETTYEEPTDQEKKDYATLIAQEAEKLQSERQAQLKAELDKNNTLSEEAKQKQIDASVSPITQLQDKLSVAQSYEQQISNEIDNLKNQANAVNDPAEKSKIELQIATKEQELNDLKAMKTDIQLQLGSINDRIGLLSQGKQTSRNFNNPEYQSIITRYKTGGFGEIASKEEKTAWKNDLQEAEDNLNDVKTNVEQQLSYLERNIKTAEANVKQAQKVADEKIKQAEQEYEEAQNSNDIIVLASNINTAGDEDAKLNAEETLNAKIAEIKKTREDKIAEAQGIVSTAQSELVKAQSQYNENKEQFDQDISKAELGYNSAKALYESRMKPTRAATKTMLSFLADQLGTSMQNAAALIKGGKTSQSMYDRYQSGIMQGITEAAAEGQKDLSSEATNIYTNISKSYDKDIARTVSQIYDAFKDEYNLELSEAQQIQAAENLNKVADYFKGWPEQTKQAFYQWAMSTMGMGWMQALVADNADEVFNAINSFKDAMTNGINTITGNNNTTEKWFQDINEKYGNVFNGNSSTYVSDGTVKTVEDYLNVVKAATDIINYADSTNIKGTKDGDVKKNAKQAEVDALSQLMDGKTLQEQAETATQILNSGNVVPKDVQKQLQKCISDAAKYKNGYEPAAQNRLSSLLKAEGYLISFGSDGSIKDIMDKKGHSLSASDAKALYDKYRNNEEFKELFNENGLKWFKRKTNNSKLSVLSDALYDKTLSDDIYNYLKGDEVAVAPKQEKVNPLKTINSKQQIVNEHLANVGAQA